MKITLALAFLCPGWLSCFLPAQPVDLKFDRFTQWGNCPAGPILDIQQDSRGFLWLSASAGTYRFDGNAFELAPAGASMPASSGKRLTTRCTDAAGYTWQGDTGLRRYASDGKMSGQYLLPGNAGVCRALFFHRSFTADSVLWVLCDSALFCFSLKTKAFTCEFRHDADNPQSLFGAPFRCAFFSDEDILWLGGESGFCKIDWRNQEFRLYRVLPAEWSSPTGMVNCMVGIRNDPSRCWMTTDVMGLILYDLDRHRVVPGGVKGELRRLCDRNTYSLAFDNLGRLWVGNTSDSVFVCDLKKRQIAHTIPLRGNQIHFVDSDFKRGRFWYLVNRGGKPAAVRIIPETMRMDTFRLPSWRADAPPNWVVSWLHDKTGTIWFLNSRQEIECFNPEPFRAEYKPLSRFNGIDTALVVGKSLRHDSDRGIIWMCAANTLYKIDWTQETATAYRNTGLQSWQSFKRLEVDDLGRPWLQVIPQNILYKFDPEREQFARYDQADGLPDYMPEAIEMDRVQDRWCQRYQNDWFMLFTPEKVPEWPARPPLLTGVRVSGREIPFTPDTVLHPAAQFAAGDNTFRFAFTSVSFEQGRQLRFRYRLAGFDTAWVYAGVTRLAYYDGLPPGKYVFTVQAANREGDWQTASAVFAFHIGKPFYAELGFQLIFILLILSLLFLGVRSWERRQQKKQTIRERIAAELHQQVGLTLDAIATLSAREQPWPESGQGAFLNRIGAQTAQASERLKDLVWAINPANDTVEQLVARIADYAVYRLQPVGMTPEVIAGKRIRSLSLPMEKRKELYQRFRKTLDALLAEKSFSNIQIIFSLENAVLEIILRAGGPEGNVERKVEPI